jgi:hypothetical protein
MKVYAIFRHSVRQLAANMGPALRISLILTLIAQTTGYLLDVQGDLARYGVMLGAFGSGVFPWRSFLPWLLVSVVSGAWIGVGWCRYVLLAEQPGTILPQFRPSRVLVYLAAFVASTLLSTLAGFLLGFLSGFVLGFLQALHLIGQTAFIVLLLALVLPFGIVLALRFTLILPAAAIGEKPSLAVCWRATRGQGLHILLAAGLVILVIILFALPSAFVFQPLTAAAYAWEGVVGWVVLMLGLSLSATLYGHYVQGRPLV